MKIKGSYLEKREKCKNQMSHFVETDFKEVFQLYFEPLNSSQMHLFSMDYF